MNWCVLSSLAGAVLMVASLALNAGEVQPGGVGSSPEPLLKNVDVDALLKAGQAAKALPPGVVVRLEADLAKSVPADPKLRAVAEQRGVDFDKKLLEIWEFTSKHVHRVVRQPAPQGSGKPVYRRVKSLPYNSGSLCQALLDGKLQAIVTEEGSGDPLEFAGTDYDVGHRAIEILVDGESALLAAESCLYAGYPESDARAFGALYQRLAQEARTAFRAKREDAAPQSDNKPTSGKMKVFILAGQSNMVGWGDSRKLSDNQRTIDDRILMFETGKWQPLQPFVKAQKNQGRFGMTEFSFGPEIAFAHHLAQAWPAEKIGIVKLAVGGTSLLTWKPDWSKEDANRVGQGRLGSLYQKLLRKVSQARRPRMSKSLGSSGCKGVAI